MDYSGKIIRKTPVTPSQTSASGVWQLDEAMQATKNNTWPVANVPNPISRSLRFRQSASASLRKNYSTTRTSGTTMTYSTWVKRGSLASGTYSIFRGFDGSSAAGTSFCFGQDGNTDKITWQFGGASGTLLATTAVYRDPSAWYHIVLAIDTTQATDTNRIKIYVNGSQVTSFSTTFYPSQNATHQFLLTNNNNGIGARVAESDNYFDGYFAETYCIDGQALTPSSFGGTNAVTGVWEPRQYTGTYGTNGFYVNFKDNTSTTTLGYDYSGNGNNWTTNNISLTAGSTYDSMLDTPTQWIGYNTGDVASVTRGNYAVLNAVLSPNATLTNGNLTTTGNYQSTMGISSGKFYWEVTFSGSNGYTGLGFTDGPYNNYVRYAPAYGSIGPAGNVTVSIGTQATYSSGTFMGCIDFANGKYWMGMNGTWFASGDPAAGTNQTGTFGTSSTGFWFPECNEFTGGTSNFNFGQRPFAYTPPAGFLSLCTTNLPSPTVLQGNQYMDATLYTGTGANATITNSGSMQPDLVWVKVRSTTGTHVLTDSVRGANKQLFSNLTNAEASATNKITGFTSTGFTLGADDGSGTGDANFNGSTYVGWQWRASNAAAVSNVVGTITSSVSANTTAGFSIVTYSGNSTTSTVGHGLSVAPSMIIAKARSNGNGWIVGHTSLGWNKWLALQSTDGEQSGNPFNSAPTSSTFGLLNTGYGINDSGQTYVAYCFTAVPGYSAFGSYVGNGSTDGTFVYTGFKPRFIMIKRSDAVNDWVIYDSARATYNAVLPLLYPNLSSAEVSSGTDIDILSNGFKIRNSNNYDNASGGTLIYMAFAENPFKNALAR